MRQSWTDDRLDDHAKRVDQRFDAVDARFDRVEARFDRVDAKFDRVDAKFDRVHDDINALRLSQERLGTELRGEMNRRFDRLYSTMVGGFLSILAALIALHFS